jgi:RNA polymerase sigma factor (sigma-70 family)
MEFASWYQGYQPRLVAALTVAVGDSHTAADAADEALVRALERWDRVGLLDSPEGWTYRVGLNLLRRRERRRAIERRLLRRVPPSPPVELHPEVWTAVQSLSARQREAIALRYLLGLPEGEVAQAMGVAMGTASATLAAARARLAVLLDDREIEVGP